MSKITLKFKEAVLKEILLDNILEDKKHLDKEIITIGRDQKNDVHIDNLAVSSFHAKIIKDGERFFVEDLNSTNGTFVNDKRVSKIPLNNNDVITIGKHTLIFTGEQTEEADSTMQIKKTGADKTIVIDAKSRKALFEEMPGAGASAERIGCLSVIDGSTDKPEYELTKRLTTIGKTETAEIKLKGLFAPKVAAIVNRAKEGYQISMAEKGKKIKINGEQIEGRHDLKDGDVVEVWNVKMQFFLKG
ncbi:MAG: FHA domain-containing protein [Nitrospirae bacterium]|nr:FHA domain-containing protein [Nitrospirota bacterium]